MVMRADTVLPGAMEAGRLRVARTREVVTDDPFTRAVADYHGELTRFAYALCGEVGQAEDHVAEAYARVWPQWRRGRVDSLLPYLRRSIANAVYTRHRRRLIERREEERSSTRDSEEPFEGRVDDRDALWTALARLPAPQRVVVVLRIVEDLSEEQTAAMLDVPVGTVKSRLSRALILLRTIMEDDRG
jgi:RNA polymerase sigma-70 factor (sigma-E family)